ncbi:MAG: putative sortase [Candidatus Peregrinibacteria bacterium Greene0416_19]|nr:MAG: putative sortase [Candidatus Peregrinibacteria bacterium Greene0416_19]
MITPNPLFHRASYDADGNIILPGSGATREGRLQELPPPEHAADATGRARSEGQLPRSAWQITDENGGAIPVHPTISRELRALRTLTHRAFVEGVDEYATAFAAAAPAFQQLEEETASAMHRLWRFLTQPLAIRRRQTAPLKKRSRGMLFFIDVFRFGGTFAGIFLVLFVALNYQSFTDIALARIRPFIVPTTVSEALQEERIADALRTGKKATAGMAGVAEFLPQVGPPDNRLIIGKLDINVPIEQPPTDSLLRQDWAQVERDIQTALEGGVVHYPGTARAGQAGNFFITGHSSYYAWSKGKFKSVFARLSDLNPGDEYWIYYGGDRHRYKVRGKREVSPTDVTVLDQPPNKRLSTLMTCTPVGTTLRRLVIVAEEVDPDTGIALKPGERTDHLVEKVQPEVLPI